MMETRDVRERHPRLTALATLPVRGARWIAQRTLGRLACWVSGHGPILRVVTPSLGLSTIDCLTCGNHQERREAA